MLEAVAHIAPSQPNEAAARIALAVQSFQFHSTQARFFGLDLFFFSKVQIDPKRGLG
jgi:hypothetical protein